MYEHLLEWSFPRINIKYQSTIILDFDDEVKFETVENSISEIEKLNIDKLFCHSVKIFVDGVVESKTALMNVKYCQCDHNG